MDMVYSLMFSLEMVEWRNALGEYRLSILHCLCSDAVI